VRKKREERRLKGEKFVSVPRRYLPRSFPSNFTQKVGQFVREFGTKYKFKNAVLRKYQNPSITLTTKVQKDTL
jgi:hypothetical protein